MTISFWKKRIISQMGNRSLFELTPLTIIMLTILFLSLFPETVQSKGEFGCRFKIDNIYEVENGKTRKFSIYPDMDGICVKLDESTVPIFEKSQQPNTFISMKDQKPSLNPIVKDALPINSLNVSESPSVSYLYHKIYIRGDVIEIEFNNSRQREPNFEVNVTVNACSDSKSIPNSPEGTGSFDVFLEAEINRYCLSQQSSFDFFSSLANMLLFITFLAFTGLTVFAARSKAFA